MSGDEIRCDAMTVAVEHTEAELRLGDTAFGGHAVPSRRLGIILPDIDAPFIMRPELILGGTDTGLSGFAQPFEALAETGEGRHRQPDTREATDQKAAQGRPRSHHPRRRLRR